jgi:hypothetical protein
MVPSETAPAVAVIVIGTVEETVAVPPKATVAPDKVVLPAVFVIEAPSVLVSVPDCAFNDMEL